MSGAGAGFIRHPVTRDRRIDHVRSLLGPEICAYLLDPQVTDIVCNPPRADDEECMIWVYAHGRETQICSSMTPGDVERLISAVGGALYQDVTVRTPYVEGELNVDGSRFSGGMPPIAPGPFFAIRKRASMVWTLDWWVEHGCMEEWQKKLLERAMQERQNVIVAGSMGCGKTSLLNGILDSAARLAKPWERFIVLEETMELQFKAARNVLSLRATPRQSLQFLVHAALRQNGDRIMLGEVRGGEALELLKAWNTGHNGGACTLHCDVTRPDAALDRLEVCIMAATPMKRLIANAVDLVVCLEKDRRVGQIVRIQGYDPTDDQYILRTEHK